MSLEIETEMTTTTTAVLKVTGDVDMHTTSKLRDILLEASEKKLEEIKVDLSGVGFMDSSGIATLVEGLQSMRKHEGALILTNLQPTVKSVFEIAHLLDVFTIE